MTLKIGNVALGALALSLTVVSCKKDDNTTTSPSPVVYPTTYKFERNGKSTVSYGGQTERKNQLSEMTTYMKTANTGGKIDAQKLKDMYANKGGNGGGHFSFTSSKQLKDKTVEGKDGSTAKFFENMFTAMEATSKVTTPGGPGKPGVVKSKDGKKAYLQGANGMEFTQIVEKGLMGAVFYYQISQGYLGDAKMNVDNTKEVDAAAGKVYTKMEHHWDEAFGYFSDKVDFPTSGTDRHLAKYCNKVDKVLGTNKKIMDAFIKGRKSIELKDMTTRDAMRKVLRTELEKVMAGTGIHYLNSSVTNIADDALRNHALSEAYSFIMGLKYGHNPTMTPAEVDAVLKMIGQDFYKVKAADLQAARDKIAAKFGWDSIKAQL